MNKKRINSVNRLKDHEVIREYVDIYSLVVVKYGGGKVDEKDKYVQYVKALEKELVERELLTEEDVHKLNS